jgi:hypothetical protein
MVFEQPGATLPGPHKGQEHFWFQRWNISAWCSRL